MKKGEALVRRKNGLPDIDGQPSVDTSLQSLRDRDPRHHIGSHAVGLAQVPEALDVVASRRAQKLFLHVVNTHRTRSVRTQLSVADERMTGGRVLKGCALMCVTR